MKRTRSTSCSTMGVLIQQTTIVNNGFRELHSIYNSWPHRQQDEVCVRFTAAVVWRQVKQEAVLILHIFCIRDPNISTGAASGWKSEYGNRISYGNFLIAFHNNYGSILLSFWDMTMERTTDDGWWTHEGNHHITGTWRASKNMLSMHYTVQGLRYIQLQN